MTTNDSGVRWRRINHGWKSCHNTYNRRNQTTQIDTTHHPVTPHVWHHHNPPRHHLHTTESPINITNSKLKNTLKHHVTTTNTHTLATTSPLKPSQKHNNLPPRLPPKTWTRTQKQQPKAPTTRLNQPKSKIHVVISFKVGNGVVAGAGHKVGKKTQHFLQGWKRKPWPVQWPEQRSEQWSEQGTWPWIRARKETVQKRNGITPPSSPPPRSETGSEQGKNSTGENTTTTNGDHQEGEEKWCGDIVLLHHHGQRSTSWLPDLEEREKAKLWSREKAERSF